MAADALSRPGSRHHQRRAHAAAGPRVAVGHVRRGLLVPRGDQADARHVVQRVQRVVELHPRQPEDDAHPLQVQRAHESLAAGHGGHDETFLMQ